MNPSKYVTPEELRKARQCDLLTYLEATQPQELIELRHGVYCLRSHDSLKISNGKWFWWSRGIGGKSAIDYLMASEGIPLAEAVRKVNGIMGNEVSKITPSPTLPARPFVLPAHNANNKRVLDYLQKRGIDNDVLDMCIFNGTLYEDHRHNCCFVGYDETHVPRYAMLRSSIPSCSFLQEVAGSDKRYSFSFPPTESSKLYVTESAIDALSLYVLRNRAPDNYLSIGGAVVPQQTDRLPAALDHFLSMYPQIETVCLCLDNDKTGIQAAQAIQARLPEHIRTELLPPKESKDYNEQLMRKKGLSNQVVTRKSKIKEDYER
jgi:hypothetical protein